MITTWEALEPVKLYTCDGYSRHLSEDQCEESDCDGVRWDGEAFGPCPCPNHTRASLGVGHVWTNVRCPAYRSLAPADCACGERLIDFSGGY